MMKNLLTIIFTFIVFSLMSQDIGFGFKAGLNFNSIRGDSETDVNGNELEDFTSNTGFHVGATFTWKATELMGVRGEFVYNQKGGRRSFEGPSYLTLTSTSGNKLATTGTRDQDLNLTTAYIDLPVMGYYKPFEWLEVYAGANLGFLVSGSVFGSLKYSGGRTSTGSGFEDFRYEIDGNYVNDKITDVVFNSPPKTISIGGNTSVEIPSSTGVYYEFDEDPGNLYKTIDLGVIGGISFNLSGSLYVSARINYGLTDVTKKDADVSLVSKDNGQFINRDDDDRNFSIQTSIGFSF